METLDKLKILAESAKYDVSCSSSGGVKRKSNNKSVGSIHTSGICHSFTADGRCVSLFKILLSNSCIYDCKYCINKVTNDIKRATFTPREVCELTISFYKRNYIEGLFLSSAIVKNPNYTMELLVQTVIMLRTEYHFKGYIHLKAIPGADQILITKAGLYVDRLSANIELPSKDSLKILAPQKTYKDILTPMHTISQKLLESGQTKTKTKELFVPAGQSTQMIVGASPEADGHIIRLSEELYNRFSLKRVYYSSYIPVNEDNLLPVVPEPTFLREHRLYQADWLLRFYDFKASELLSVNQNFNLALDPKANYALNNMNLFPVNIQTASYKLLLRVPGIGVRSAKRIVEARRFTNLRFEDLVKIGVVMKRAKYFIICRGKYFMDLKFKEETIKDYIIMDEKIKNKVSEGVQLSIFDLPSYEIMSSVTGEY
ncbi:putative DNA modification/repair radical SAM protein [Acetoanaerobium noterae]|uniref:Putative DNA modification/repair radical SAM protein n=1 Tax=Acetoanaerobium noterae TaxID=745369 RepID=A0A1T4ZSD0_9FIRM|nr:putative DNA modification/repair radical SAM protein [Acetoanaerobium noterae]SKB25546.1 putative DNA modification/repair radical SAM protein [Acetoanaerobium noterae]